MKQGADLRLRAGALAFATAAVMNIPAIFSIHPPTDPGHNREFAMGANTASYRLATTLQIYALIPVIFGMIALYAILATTPARRWAMASLVLTISGAGLALPGGGFAAVVMPAAGGAAQSRRRGKCCGTSRPGLSRAGIDSSVPRRPSLQRWSAHHQRCGLAIRCVPTLDGCARRCDCDYRHSDFS
jgi:hypothetical protein